VLIVVPIVSKDFASGKWRLRANTQTKFNLKNKSEMKTQTESSSIRMRFPKLMMYVLLAGIGAIASCSDDDEAKPDTRGQFLGTYAVEDVSDKGYVYEYDMTIANSDDGTLSISNFADIFNVPVKASVDGTKITIKSQSFTNPSSGNTIKVSGNGTLTGNVLKFTYTTDGYLDYIGTCTANKKQ
jgi:hypothetical protein